MKASLTTTKGWSSKCCQLTRFKYYDDFKGACTWPDISRMLLYLLSLPEGVVRNGKTLLPDIALLLSPLGT